MSAITPPRDRAQREAQTCLDLICGTLRISPSPDLASYLTDPGVAALSSLPAVAAELAVRRAAQTLVRQVLTDDAGGERAGLDVNLRGAVLHDFDAHKAAFRGETDFAEAHFVGQITDFASVTLDRAGDGDTTFQRAEFSAAVTTFDGARFAESALAFDRAVFDGEDLRFDVDDIAGMGAKEFLLGAAMLRLRPA